MKFLVSLLFLVVITFSLVTPGLSRPTPKPTSKPTSVPTLTPRVPVPLPYLGYYYYFYGRDTCSGSYLAQMYEFYKCVGGNMYIYDGTYIKSCYYTDQNCSQGETCRQPYHPVDGCVAKPSSGYGNFPDGAEKLKFCSATSCDFSGSVIPVELP